MRRLTKRWAEPMLRCTVSMLHSFHSVVSQLRQAQARAAQSPCTRHFHARPGPSSRSLKSLCSPGCCASWRTSAEDQEAQAQAVHYHRGRQDL